MTFHFGKLSFQVEEGKVTCSLDKGLYYPFAEVQIAGSDKNTHLGAKLISSSEEGKLRFIGKEETESSLKIIQESELVRVETTFERFQGNKAIRISTRIANIAHEDIVLEEAPIIALGGLFPADRSEEAYFTRFIQGHHIECQVRRQSLFDLGITCPTSGGQFRVARANIGSWSSKEELPQGILEYDGKALFFEIESNASWYYEISDWGGNLYLCLSGPNYPFGGWAKKLKSGETYETPKAGLALENSVEEAIFEMSKYRRIIKGRCSSDESLPAIFNEYMHLSWDSPDEKRTRAIAPIVAKAGIKYYVIDCGWSNEEKGSEVYPYLGQWKQSHARFPSGVKKTADFINSLGMKMGLWIEPEIIGNKCQEMLDYYDDDCFVKRHGKKVCVMGRYFLDFRNQKVRDYLTSSISRMINEYGARYIKLDYNQDMGVGNENDAYSAGEGLELCARAYLSWIDEMRKMFPDVLFETCSSGGMRMDYLTLSHFSLVSTSDQTDYKKYPYIAGNIFSAVLPEQAAVWSYPVASSLPIGTPFEFDEAWVDENISEERIVFNMVNSLLGRIHLASRIDLLSKEKFALIQEGIEVYDSLAKFKKEALPFFPTGFANFKSKYVSTGLTNGNKAYLSLWSTGGGSSLSIPLKGYTKARCVYPKKNSLAYSLKDGVLTIEFTEPYQARLFELEK